MTHESFQDLSIRPFRLDESPERGRRARADVGTVTVVIPTYNRTKYIEWYLEEGLWDEASLLVVSDGSEQAIVDALQKRAEGRDLRVHHYQPNRGVAHAVGVGIRETRTPYLLLSADDDIVHELETFVQTARRIYHQADDVLYVAMRPVYVFNEQCQFRLQYDRSPFDGMTGRELLTYLVKTGEMHFLTGGALFRSRDLVDVLPESMFKVNEDYLLLVRFCAQYPDRRLHVVDEGRYLRLIHGHSLSNRAQFTVEKLLMNLISMTVGASYLAEMGVLDAPSFCHVLKKRGAVLQQSYGMGKEAAHTVAALIGHPGGEISTEEGRRVIRFLQDHRTQLPAEFVEMLSDAGRQYVDGGQDSA